MPNIMKKPTEENEFINIYRIDTSDTNIYVTPNTISSSDLTTITKGTTASVDVSYLRAAGIIYNQIKINMLLLL